MNTASSTQLPFLLNFVAPIEKSRYDEAIGAMELLSSSYDPDSQVSALSGPQFAGTQLTYTQDTGFINSDTVQTDT